MNSKNECNESATVKTAIDEPGASTCNLEPATGNSASSWFAHRGNGKIARLPKAARDQINQWIFDGVSYPDIIERLGEQGKDLKPDNLSQWKKRGHQDWLVQQAWLAQTRARQEPASDLSIDFDATQLNHAALQLGTLQMFEVLRELTASAVLESNSNVPTPLPATQPQPPKAQLTSEHPPSPRGEGRGEGGPLGGPLCGLPHPTPDHDLKQPSPHQNNILDRRLGGDSAAFVRLMNALVRASRETMLVQKYREACSRARAALRQLDPNRKLDENETRAIVRKVDEIFGFPSQYDSTQPPRRDELSESPLSPPNAPASTGPFDVTLPVSN